MMAETWRPHIAERKNPRIASGTADRRERNRMILKALLWIGITMNALFVLLLVYSLFLRMPYFDLHQVDVTGNQRLARDEIVEAAEIEAGINLLTVNLAAVANRVKRHPWIRSAVVYRRFPGQLIVEIEERTPRAILAAEKLYYVDEQAEFFSRLLPGDSVDYPLFAGVTASQLKDNGLEIREMIRLGLGLLDLMDRTRPSIDASGISEIRIDVGEGLTLVTSSGQLIVLGKSNFEQKLERY
ncbi:MAG: FtsQ-type POTRA domain-containing protein, partial [Deltaproteobacteria bacterium]|nr:FtsQ-type POTRA domain-containing protein [Deltaproteobacteria bacterium]